MRIRQIFLFLLLVSLFMQSCNTIDVYERTIALPKQEWSSKVKLNYNCIIKDSTSYYNIFFVIRHTESYHFNNIWLTLTSFFPGDTARTQRLNIQLTNGSGWLGTSMDDIIEQRLLLNKQPVHLRSGIYKFSMQQIMREDPLENIVHTGIRIEKAVQ